MSQVVATGRLLLFTNFAPLFTTRFTSVSRIPWTGPVARILGIVVSKTGEGWNCFFSFFNLNLKILLYEILETSDLAFFWRKNYIKVYFYSIEVVFIQKIKFCRESYRLRIEKNIVEVSRVNRSWKWEIIRRENKVEIDIYSKRYLLYYLYCQFVWRLLNARINIYALRFRFTILSFRRNPVRIERERFNFHEKSA